MDVIIELVLTMATINAGRYRKTKGKLGKPPKVEDERGLFPACCFNIV